MVNHVVCRRERVLRHTPRGSEFGVGVPDGKADRLAEGADRLAAIVVPTSGDPRRPRHAAPCNPRFLFLSPSTLRIGDRQTRRMEEVAPAGQTVRVDPVGAA